MAAQDWFVSVNGLTLHYLDWGTVGKPPMLLLHGLRGHAHVWDDVAAAFCGDHRVLALDQRGRGESAWAPDGQYTIEAYVSDLAAVVDTLRLPPVVLVGHSMGGRNGMLFAARHSERLRALVVVDIGPDIDARGTGRMTAEFRETPEEFDAFETLVAASRLANPRAPEAVLRRRLRYQTRPLPDGKVGWRYDKVIRDQWKGETRPAPPDLWPAVSQITCPTLLVRGAQTDIFPIEVAKRMLDLIPGSRLAEIAHAGHMTFEENAADSIAAIRDFLATVPPTPSPS